MTDLDAYEVDGTAYPYVEDLQYVWHMRRPDDEWVVSSDGPNAQAFCGLVLSVHVSTCAPEATALLCPECKPHIEAAADR